MSSRYIRDRSTYQLSSKTYVSTTSSEAVCPLAMSQRSRSCSELETAIWFSALSADRNGDSLISVAFNLPFSNCRYAELGRLFICCEYEGGRNEEVSAIAMALAKLGTLSISGRYCCCVKGILGS